MTGAPARTRRWAPVVVPAVGVGLATLALHVRDPHQRGSWGFCPTALMGFDCPGCGALRAVHHLTNGDLLQAASSNLLLVLAVPLLIAWWVRAIVRAARHEPRPWHLVVPRVVWIPAALLVLAFAVLRNLPLAGALGEWLAS